MITYESEQGKIEEITSVEQAKRVIIANATVRCHTKQSLLEDKDILGIANAFKIDLNDVIITESDHYLDYPFKYSI